MAAKITSKEIESGMLFRSFSIERSAISEGEDERTVELSFSSETPVEQYNWDYGRYLEVLDHTPSSVDMSRLSARAPLLLEHERDEQIGVVEEASIVDRKGKAKVRFSRNAKADEIFRDVKDGIRSLVSVGYRVTKLVVEKVEETGLDTLRAMSWQPMEISIVSVPADFSVGVGRSERSDGNKVTIETPFQMKRFNILRDPAPAEGGGGTPIVPASAPVPQVDQTKTVREQAREMFLAAKAHGKIEIYESALERGLSLVDFQKELLAKVADDSKRTVVQSAQNQNENLKRTLGDILVQSSEYRDAVAKGGGAHRNIAIEIPKVYGVEQFRATLLTTTGLTSYERPPGIVTLGQQPLTIAQLFAQGTTSSSTVRVTQEVSYTQAATAVAEEGQKPEASFDLVETDFAVKKIAVVGRVSDEMFSDYPQVQAYVNSRLIYMVGALEDNHLINGDGSSNKITGILSTSGIQTVSAGASATVIDAIFKAMTKIAAVGFFQPDYIVVHPTDWQNIKLSKDSSGQYYAGGPFTGAYGLGGYTVAGTLWGLPVIATTSISQGTALVGAFTLGAQLFRREGIRLDTTNSDASDFQYNRIAIRVETRLALAVYRPLAFCTVTSIPNV